MSGPPASKLNKILRILAVNLGVLCLLLLVVEGLASYMLLGSDILATRSLAERRHTRYDPDLGWVNIPDLHLPDMYGEGIYLRTNGQGFRANQEVAPEVPEGRVRIICSGDSFTLGYGVSNDHTWCRQLADLDPVIETVNMGQGGYGIDQAWLWYRRDGMELDHQLQILAFITDDFQRMQSDSFIGYGKPLVITEEEELVVKNVPVPQRTYRLSWLIKNVHNFKRLRKAQLLTGALGAGRRAAETGVTDQNVNTREVLSLIITEMEKLNREKSSRLVLVYFPVIDELRGAAPQEWIRFFRQEADRHGLPLIDLVTEFRSRPFSSMAGLFIPEGELDYPAAAGHFNEEGNRFVAELILRRLTEDPAMAEILSGGPTGG